jgi:hypothetical protein
MRSPQFHIDFNTKEIVDAVDQLYAVKSYKGKVKLTTKRKFGGAIALVAMHISDITNGNPLQNITYYDKTDIAPTRYREQATGRRGLGMPDPKLFKKVR